MPTALIVGGTSGLGLELARQLTNDHRVVVTGRKNPHESGLSFGELHLDRDLEAGLDRLLAYIGPVDLLIYAAGFYQEGRISDLSDADLREMNHVGLLAPAMLLQRILIRQERLPAFVAITSTSQWTPRLLEPMYTAVKAGVAMLAKSVALDERVGKVLVMAPSGMHTPLWVGHRKDVSGMLDPKWVAEETLKLMTGEFEYRFARILRDPARVEIAETR